jgi:hypothetical protein
MSLMLEVVDEIRRRRKMTLEQLRAEFPQHPELKVQKALYNASSLKLVEVVGVSTGSSGKGSAQRGIWAVCQPAADTDEDGWPIVDPTTLPRPVASVFELGDRARAEQFDARSRALGRT